ncbi:hypothetical protein GX48_04904 [Paracoccidioides brasiliensis]|nr:hypothetical protein GX48_04904 [Paracoccidioides brasiliensis]
MAGHNLHHESNNSSSANSTYSDLNPTYSLTPVPSESKGSPKMLPEPNPVARRKRKAPSVASSRGVAHLTPEQLAKKRANDREAQRAIRKRTKAQIETLEQRVQELTSQQPYQDLLKALSQKHAVEKENEDIRRMLASVLAMIQPVVNGGFSKAANTTPNSCKTEPDPFSGNGSCSRSWSTQYHGAPPSPVSNSELPVCHHPSTTVKPELPLRMPASSFNSVTAPGMGPVDSPRILDNPPPSVAVSPGHALRPNCPGSAVPTHPTDPRRQPSNNFDSERKCLSHDLDFSGSGERLGFNFLLSSPRQVPKISERIRSSSSPPLNVSMRYRHVPPSPCNQFDPYISPHMVPVRNVDPTCPMDGILLDFLRTRQREAEDGTSKQVLVGPPYPSVSSLLNPAKSAYSHPLSKVFTDILSKFPGISNLPEQVAVLYVMFLLMRWQIYPTQQNYDRLPEWLTPRISQIMTPHPAWMDYLPWPRMRDRMVASYKDYEFQNWFIPYTTTLSINWPYEGTDTLLTTADSEELIINPVFERHLRNLNNWSLGPAFAKAYPGLIDTTRIVPELRDHPGPSARPVK